MRILFSCFPGLGHVRPTLPLARAARAAGHSTIHAVAPENVAWVREQGFDAQPAGLSHQHIFESWRARHPEIEGMDRMKQFRHLLPHAMVEIAARSKIDELTDLAVGSKADLLIWTTSDFSGPISAELVGLPHISHGVTVSGSAGEAGELVEGPLSRLCGELGIADGCWSNLRPKLRLDIVPPSLSVPSRGYDVARQPIRPVEIIRERNPHPLLVGLPDGETIYVSMGTVVKAPRLIEAILAALEGEGVNALVTGGRSESDLAASSERVRVARFVPQEEILPDCSMVICHAGAGTTLGALAHRLPLLLFPQAVDQFAVAGRCAAAGAAIVMRRVDYDVARIREEIRRLRAQPDFRLNARRIAGEIALMPSPEHVLPRVEQVR